MRTQIVIIFTAVLLSFGIAQADFTATGKMGEAYTASESLKDDFQRTLDRIVALGVRTDQLKVKINNRLGVEEAGKFQTTYINAMQSALNDVNTAWAARVQ